MPQSSIDLVTVKLLLFISHANSGLSFMKFHMLKRSWHVNVYCRPVQSDAE